MQKHRIVLVEDHPLLRAGVRSAIAASSELAIVAEAGDVRSALEVIKTHLPDLVLLDISLPGSDGIALTRQLVRTKERPKILIFSMHKGIDYVRLAIGAGAGGYALKDDPPHVLLEAIRAVLAGELYLSPQVRDRALTPQGVPASDGTLDRLSAREREIFSLIVHGHSSQSIAKELCISIKTVETHRAHINQKLGVHSTGEIVRLAAHRGLLPA